jgi:3-oxoacyl-[acyl-carrier-protein] synthase-1
LKTPVYITAHNTITPLGFSTKTTFSNLLEGKSAIQLQSKNLLPEPYYAATIPTKNVQTQFESIGDPSKYTKLEQLLLLSAKDTLSKTSEKVSDKTGLIVATTKGNIDVLENDSRFPVDRAYLSVLATTIAQFYGITTQPVVLSNACVSGILAVTVAQRMLQTTVYENVLIVAGDLVTQFTLSGFYSFQALSNTPCKPYSKNRNGISLGEAVASVWVTKIKPLKNGVQVLGGASCNDANHISGPSRTGEGLYKSIVSAIESSEITTSEIDFISAHGTATPYNDEMEAQAFTRAGLQHTPLHSLKGYFGHTLGAAGLLEAVLSMHSMQEGVLIPSYGFGELGVTKPLQIIEQKQHKESTYFLKTASGFGGCNATVVFKKLS